MPFQLTLTVPDWGGGQPLILRDWHIRQQIMFKRGDVLFSLIAGDRGGAFCSNMPGYLVELLVKKDTNVQPGQALAVVAVDGEDIPYGRPYVSEKRCFLKD